MLNKDFVKKYLTELFSYHKREMSDFVFEVWYQKLASLSERQFISAVAKGIAEATFMPSAKQILEFAQGEYRPPGECVMGNFTIPALPSHEDRLSPEQIAELSKRGRIVARIILNCTGYMTPERKEGLIEQFKTTPTHELERIAFMSDRTRKGGTSINNIASILSRMEENFNSESADGSYEDSTRAIARDWLEESND